MESSFGIVEPAVAFGLVAGLDALFGVLDEDAGDGVVQMGAARLGAQVGGEEASVVGPVAAAQESAQAERREEQDAADSQQSSSLVKGLRPARSVFARG